MLRSQPGLRAGLALLLFSAWMGLLFSGFALRGAIHLLLVGAVLLFPWRALPPPAPPAGRSGAHGIDAPGADP